MLVKVNFNKGDLHSLYMSQTIDDLPKKMGRKRTFDDEIHKAWRVAALYKYQQKKLRGIK